MFGSILIAFGALIALGTMLLGAYFVNLGCAMSTTRCEQNILQLIGELMISPEGTVFWAGVAIGVVLIWVGNSIKSYRRQKG